MDRTTTADRTTEVRAILLELAKRLDDRAATEAASVPYWSPCPPSVLGDRTAAEVLRAHAEEYRPAMREAS